MAARMWRRAVERTGDPLVVRWIFLRGLGVIYLSVFWSLAGQIHGLIGPRGVQPAGAWLATLRAALTTPARLWVAPTLLWLGAGDGALTALVVAGFVGAAALVANLWPRAALLVAGVAFLSFAAAGQAFAMYQSDGMLLEATALSLFYAPRGLRPGLGAASPPSRASLWLVRWEWLRIYFESGVVKLASGETQWRDLSAMVKYYENGPLPTWIGWYMQQWLPRGFHVGLALCTLALELVGPLALFLPRRWRVSAFVLFSAFQLGIIASANYAFLNYLVLLLGVLMLCDAPPARTPAWRERLGWVGFGAYALTTLFGFFASGPLAWPARLLAPFRIGESYGLFAVMTRVRYEIEFQGTRDGKTWIAYPFRYKPQDPYTAPGIYAPYQPRFDWDLWFASLDDVSEWPWVVTVEERLLAGEPAVLRLFARDPFGGDKPIAVRAIKWQYWFTTPAEKRATGAWWRREEIGPYAPPVP
jgi:lipase maturation factor 1